MHINPLDVGPWGRGVLLIVGILVFIAACAPVPSTPAPTIIVRALDTATPRPSFTPEPTMTDSPTPAGVMRTNTVAHTPAPAATLPFPTATRPPATLMPPSLVSSGGVSVYEGRITLTAYPYAQFLVQRQDAAHHFIYNALDWNAYEQALNVQGPAPRSFDTVVLENEFLRLTFLPDLGGRLYQITYKPTGQNVFYNNHVLKPSPWGPINDRGWLAVGGMEWALPVNEHGYEWGIPWPYAVAQNVNGATITLSDSSAVDRVRARISVTLLAHAAYVVVQPHIENPTSVPASFQFWINAQVSLGANPNVSPGTEFVLPSAAVFVHSTGDAFIPKKNVPADDITGPVAPISWPVVGGVDLSRYSNWQDYLGVFAADPRQGFAGAYNHENDLGLARVFPPAAVPGLKLFAFGPRFCCRNQFSDDGSDYFELWGGLSRTFFPSDDATLGPGEARQWDEYWIPFGGTGGLSAATRSAVLYVTRDGDRARVGAYAPIARAGTLVLLRDGTEARRWTISLAPGAPFTANTPVAAGHLELRLLANDGTILADSN
ncbi:MAG: DUF5107 domain-containing protein [Anaerolineae bacterium]